MDTAVSIIIGVGSLALFLWLMSGVTVSTTGDQPIDPTDARQIGALIGMTGGSITDAASVQFAIRRFEEIHGRKPTVKDMGHVAGIMKSHP